MRILSILLIAVSTLQANAQLKLRTVEKSDGVYQYSYHRNGQLASEIFHSHTPTYLEGGYARAYNPKGELIYERTISRSGMLSSVLFSYYESGAVRSAEYSSHPDAGIQWYREWTFFDESGQITGVNKESWDDLITLVVPDSTQMRMEREYEMHQLKEKQAKEEAEKQKQVLDSINFYKDSVYTNAEGIEIHLTGKPADGYRVMEEWNSKKKISSLTEFYQKNNGIQSIQRTYYRNGQIHEEFIYESQVYHHRIYSSNGRLIQENLNIPVVQLE